MTKPVCLFISYLDSTQSQANANLSKKKTVIETKNITLKGYKDPFFKLKDSHSSACIFYKDEGYTDNCVW